MSCRSVTDLLHREVDALDETERLILEDHLAVCERCRGDRARLQLLRGAAAGLPVPPAGSRAYSRAIARALLDGRASAAAPASRWRIPGTAACLVAAILAIVVIARRTERTGELPAAAQRTGELPAAAQRTGELPTAAQPEGAAAAVAEPPAPGPKPERVPPSGPPGTTPERGGRAPEAIAEDIVEDGTLVARTTAVVRRAAIPPDTLLRAPRPVRLRIGSYRVVVAASSEVQWSATDRALLLFRGSLDVDGTGSATVRARVVTERFEIELDDTALTVDATAVRVRRGAARVVDRGHRLLAHVEAGRTWRSSAPPAAPDPATVTASAADLLAEARAQLAAHDHDAAGQTALRALAAASSRGDRADARMLIADVAQASGALDRAVARYLEVAAEFDDLPVAESALYAAARIELHRSRTAAARAVLERYLARFPTGRYADDARRELGHP